jgi:hypothetical protein
MGAKVRGCLSRRYLVVEHWEKIFIDYLGYHRHGVANASLTNTGKNKLGHCDIRRVPHETTHKAGDSARREFIPNKRR